MTVTASERPPAEIYDEKFVPALFGQWGRVVAGAAAVRPGQSVLDVACGTGASTLAALEMVGPSGKVSGLDANPEMLAVARRKSDDIEWRHGAAEALPFDDASFDAVISQFGFMFFDDRPKALSEMMRVLKPEGCMAVAVCGALARSPGYSAFATLLDTLFGDQVGDAFRAPFVLGEPELLADIAADAGLENAHVEERNGTVQFATIADLVATERACAWTLGGILDQAQFALLLERSEEILQPFADAEGLVRFDMPALILKTRKTRG